MNDYRGKLCIIDEKIIKRCVGQDFNQGQIYFETPDSDIFYLGEDRVRVLTDEEKANFSLYGKVNLTTE
jgi:hypothetical protein